LKLPIGTDEFISKQEIFNSLFNKIKSNQTQIRTLTALRDTLLPKLMSGEVSLSNFGEVRVEVETKE
jgi:type I restriction enzyme S subunit